MKTRRDFLKTASVVPLTGLLDGPSLLLIEGDDHSGEEPIYAGKPMGYWLAKLNSRDYDRDVYDLGEQWMFIHFGDAAVPGLIEALRHDCAFSAETELEGIGSPATVRALTHALKDEDRRVRLGSAVAMYGIGLYKPRFRPEVIPAYRVAFPVLAEVLKTDQDPHVARMATWILFEFAPKMDPTFPLPLDISDYENAGFWAQLVRRFPKHFQAEDVAPLLIAQLDNEDTTVRLEVAQTLSMFEPDHPEIAPIFVAYATERESITALEFSGLDRIVVKALPALRRALRNENPKVRTSILHALGWSGSPAVIPTLAEGLEDESSEVRCQAVSSLYFVDSPAALPLLVRALEDSSRYVRKQARWVLNHHGHLGLAALSELSGFLEAADPTVRNSAALALKDLDKESEQTLAALRRNLDHDDLCVRLEAAIALSEMEPDRSDLVHILAEGIDCDEHDLRAAAIDALNRVGRNAEAVLPQIIAGLDNSWERQGLIWILAELGPEAVPAIPRLIDMMKDQKAGTRIPEVLGKIGPKAIPRLVEATRDSDLLIRSRAIKALGHLGKSASQFVPMLIKVFEEESAVLRIAAAEALGNIGRAAASAIPALKKASADRDIAIRVHAQTAAGAIESNSTA